jgi:hypothetical protein
MAEPYAVIEQCAQHPVHPAFITVEQAGNNFATQQHTALHSLTCCKQEQHVLA